MLIARTFAGDAKRDTAAQHTTNEALGAMNDPISKDNVLNINGRLAMKPGFDTSGFISTLRARALKRLPALLGEVLGKADDTLFDFVQRADGKLNHQEYFDAMRELRRQRPQIEQRFADHISSTFAAYDQRAPLRVDLEQGTREMAKGELSLVSEEDLEEQLSTRMVAVAIARQMNSILHPLHRRMAALIGAAELDDDNNPIGPAHIAYAFRMGLQTCDVSVRVKVLLYKLYERELPNVLQPFYNEVNRSLIDAGILPEIRPTVMRKPGAPAGARVSPLDPARSVSESDSAPEQDYASAALRGLAGMVDGRAAPRGEVPVSEGTEQMLFSTIHDLLEAYRSAQGGMTYGIPAAQGAPTSAPHSLGQSASHGGLGETTPLRPLSPNEMLSVLSLYQAELPESVSAALDDPDQSLAQKIKQEVLNGAERLGLNPEQSRMTAADEDAIDLVGMLFEVMLDERDFHSETRRQISRLIVPFIKVALLDRRMFLQKSHPARRLLNSLAEAAEGNSGEAPQDRELLDRVQRTIERLSAEFNEDIAIFETLEQEFREFIEQHRRRIALAERRAAEAQRGKERLDFSRAAAVNELESRLRQHPGLPPAMESFLRRYWVHHLTLMGLRDGHESPKFLAAVSAGDALLGAWLEAEEKASFSDAAFSALRPQLDPVLQSAGVLGSAADEVMESLRAALSAVKAPQSASSELVDVIERNAPPSNAVNVPEPAAAEADDADDEASPALEFDAADIERIRKLEVGAWVQFIDEEGNSQPAKLSWFSPISNRMLFVNRRGLRYCVASAEELAAMIQSKRLVIRQNDAAFEHAMNQVLGRLRANAPTKSGP